MEAIIFVILTLTLMIVYWYWFDKNKNEKVKLQRKLNDYENICRILKENFDKAEKAKKQYREDYNNLKSFFDKSKEKEAKINVEGIFGKSIIHKYYNGGELHISKINYVIVKEKETYISSDGKVLIDLKYILDDIQDKDLFISRSDILKRVEKIVFKDERTNN